MSYEPPVLNPSQAVERIREIIIGKQMDHFDGRLLETEAKLEALQESVSRMKQTGVVETNEDQREDVRQMAQRIQEIAKQRAEDAIVPALDGLERKLGQWLSDWQISLRQRLEERDRALEEKIRKELADLREVIDRRFEEIELKSERRMESRFERIAEAAKMLADCAAEVAVGKR